MTSRQLFQLARKITTRQISTSVARQVAKDEVHPGYKKIKELQKFFQKDDGLEVHLKRGLTDNLMYRGTLILCAVALLLDFKLYYDLAYPSKKK